MKKVLQVYKHTDTLIIKFPELDYDHNVSRQVKKSLPNLMMKHNPKALIFDVNQAEKIDNEGLASIVLSWNLCCTRNIPFIITGLKQEDRSKQGLTFLIETTETLQEALQLAVNSVHVQHISNVVTKNMDKVFGDVASNPLPAVEDRIVKIKKKLQASKQEMLTA